MQDRVPVNPGRVLVTPENGGAAYYATLTRADNPTQEGTPLNKASLLKDTTAALFGLDENAVPDDALEKLSGLYLHYWKRRTHNSYPGLIPDVTMSSQFLFSSSSASATSSYVYGNSYTISEDGRSITINNPNTVTISYSTYKNANDLVGKYFRGINEPENVIYYITDDAEAYAIKSGGSYKFGFTKNYIPNYSWIIVQAGEWEYLYSSNGNAYPDSGLQEGYEYQYLGVPFENTLKTHVKIATGSYVGTGTYGESNPNSLTFDFEPKAIYFVGSSLDNNFYDGYVSLQTRCFLRAAYDDAPNLGILVDGYLKAAFGKGNIYGYIKFEGNAVHWYGTSDSLQLNRNRYIYYYIAFG